LRGGGAGRDAGTYGSPVDATRPFRHCGTAIIPLHFARLAARIDLEISGQIHERGLEAVPFDELLSFVVVVGRVYERISCGRRWSGGHGHSSNRSRLQYLAEWIEWRALRFNFWLCICSKGLIELSI